MEINVLLACSPEREPLLKCVTSGLILQVARRNDGDVSTTSNDAEPNSKSGTLFTEIGVELDKIRRYLHFVFIFAFFLL